MRVLSFDELKPQKGIRLSREQIRQKRKDGTFPEPLAMGENSVAWLESEIDAWIESRPRAIAATDNQAGPTPPVSPSPFQRTMLERRNASSSSPPPARSSAVPVTSDGLDHPGYCLPER
jgi:prophage regulatory protein